MIETDWPLTLQLLGVILTLAALIAGVFAAVWAKKAAELQERQTLASPAGIEVSDAELRILRLVDDAGMLLRSNYAWGGESTNCWLLRKTGERILEVKHAPANAWIFKTLEALRARELLIRPTADDTLRITDNGRWVVRRDREKQLDEGELQVHFHKP